MVTRASVTRRSVWGLMCHDLISEDSSRAWLRDKAESQNTVVLLPHSRGSSSNCSSIPQFHEVPDPEVANASVPIRLSGIDCPEKGQATAYSSSTPPLTSSSGSKSRSRLMVSTSMDARLEI